MREPKSKTTASKTAATLASLLALIMIALWPRPASPTQVAAVSIERLAQMSERVTLGTVVHITSYLGERGVARQVVVAVDEQWKQAPTDSSAEATSESEVVLTVPGGVFDGIATRVPGAPDYHVGERAVLFLYERPGGTFATLGLGFGKWTVQRADEREVAIRTMPEGALVQPRSNPNAASSAAATDADDELPLDALRERVQRALEEGGELQ